MTLTLKVWRQAGPQAEGHFEEYKVDGIIPDMSFLEMMDVLNQKLIVNNVEPVTFDHDCREGICGTCLMVINGSAHGPDRGVTTCQLHMRRFQDGDTIVIEPARAKAFPIIKDLSVDRSAFDRITAKGGFISVSTGNAPDANAIPVPKEASDLAMDAAQCIGCGACVASCKNASAMLYTSAKVSHFALLPQGQPERASRVLSMVKQMDFEGFGNCTNTGACEAACPKEITLENIARMNREYMRAMFLSRKG
ncbi:MAG: succinate dehydrogenase/fumarate reductase iron-sulfur subunit [Bdellovibrionota bacterium]